MKKYLILIVLFFFVIFCKKTEKKIIDITTQRILAIQDTIPLRITHISPFGLVEGQRETFKILVGFNQAMVPLQVIPRDETKGPLEIEPSIKGKYRWLGARTLAFIPDDSLQPATSFRITLKKDNIKSLTGMKLVNDTSWTFESVRPALVASRPYQGDQFIDTKAYIYLNFNIEMAPERIGDKIKIYTVEGMPSRVWCGTINPRNAQFRKEVFFRVRFLKDDEKKEWPYAGWDSKKTVVLMPTSELPREAMVEVYLKPGLLAKTGNLGTTDNRVLSFNTYNFFSVLNYKTSISGEEGLGLCFSNRVKVSELVKHITIKPEVEIPAEYQKNDWGTSDMTLYLPFKVNTTYDIAIDAKLKDIYGKNLDQAYGFKIFVGDYRPHTEIPTGLNILENMGDLRFPATFINVDSVYLQIGTLNIDNAIPFLNTPDLFYSYKKFVPATKEFFKISNYWNVNTFKKFRNEKIRLPIELKDVLDKRSGFVFIQFDNLGQNRWSNNDRYYKSFIEVGNLGITWKYAPENNIVWITSLNDTRPIKNAK